MIYLTREKLWTIKKLFYLQRMKKFICIRNKKKDTNYDYVYMFENAKLTKVWKSKEHVDTFVLPKIDYEENDKYLYGFDLKLAKELFKTDMAGDDTFTQEIIKDTQKRVISDLAQGRYSISTDAFSDINNEDYETRRNFESKPVNIIVTGNASIAFNSSSFGAYANINLILPKGMNMYSVIQREDGLLDYSRAEWFVISSKIIENATEIYKNNYCGIFVDKIDEVNASYLHITVDRNLIYDRKNNCIIDRSLTSNVD